MRAFILVAALLLAARACEGAALLRFINTVPTRYSATNQAAVSYALSYPFTNPSTPTYGTAHVTADQPVMDRVGLSYYANAVTSASSVLSPTIVWTEPFQAISGDTGSYAPANSPFAWTMGMPSLRSAHTVLAGAATYSDSVDQITGSTLTGADDWLDQGAWKADGVSLYLSFAAGTYQMQAFSVMGSTPPAAGAAASPYQNVQRAFTGATGQFTFADQAVYTLVAIGNGQYLATPTPLVGNTVTLQLFQESTAPATFGMATVRWFHAIRSYSTATISVFPGDASSNPALVSGIPFGGLSNYVDVAPNLMQVFPITASTTNSVIAPVSANRLEVTHDLRAGVRATIICAMNNEADAKIFCRQIPSRVVAYVRLVNDLAGTSSPTSGAFGSVPLKYVNLSLFASYEYPRPEQTYELSQSGAERSLWNSPANMRGLYGAVTAVAPGTVSGYGEVFVPLFIMDFATRWSVASDSVGDLGTTMSGSGTANAYAIPNQNLPSPQETSSGSNNWFFGAPIVKRVNFIVKTDSGATLSGIASGAESAVQRLYNFPISVPTGIAATTVPAQGGATLSTLYTTTIASGWYSNAVTVDNYLEPGQYYTIIAQATYPASNAASTVPVTNTMPTPSAVTFYWRLDRTLSQVSSGIPTGQGAVNWIPVGKSANYQDFSSGKVNLRPGSTATTTTYSATGLAATATTGAMSNSPSASIAPVANPTGLPIDVINTAPTFTVPAAAYTFDFTAGSSQTCYNGFTGSTPLTISSGDVWDIYVLNVYGCLANSNNLNMLSIVPVKTQSALMTNNAAGTLLSPSASSTNTASPTFFFGAAPALSVSMSFIIATIFAAIATLL